MHETMRQNRDKNMTKKSKQRKRVGKISTAPRLT